MLNNQNDSPITSKEYFLLMRLLQHLENEGTLPIEESADWQEIYNKLNYNCLIARGK